MWPPGNKLWRWGFENCKCNVQWHKSFWWASGTRPLLKSKQSYHLRQKAPEIRCHAYIKPYTQIFRAASLKTASRWKNSNVYQPANGWNNVIYVQGNSPYRKDRYPPPWAIPGAKWKKTDTKDCMSPLQNAQNRKCGDRKETSGCLRIQEEETKTWRAAKEHKASFRRCCVTVNILKIMIFILHVNMFVM